MASSPATGSCPPSSRRGNCSRPLRSLAAESGAGRQGVAVPAGGGGAVRDHWLQGAQQGDRQEPGSALDRVEQGSPRALCRRASPARRTQSSTLCRSRTSRSASVTLRTIAPAHCCRPTERVQRQTSRARTCPPQTRSTPTAFRPVCVACCTRATVQCMATRAPSRAGPRCRTGAACAARRAATVPARQAPRAQHRRWHRRRWAGRDLGPAGWAGPRRCAAAAATCWARPLALSHPSPPRPPRRRCRAARDWPCCAVSEWRVRCMRVPFGL